MIAADREFGGDGGLLGAGPHQPRIGAPAKRQPQGVEQDRFPGTGLPGQHAQPGTEGERQPVDQNDIADGEAEQHAGAVIPKPPQ